MQPIMLSIVDFPEPEGPAMEMKSPLQISTLTTLYRMNLGLA
jgi:hypothetical protein